jgi:hypothetical protein
LIDMEKKLLLCLILKDKNFNNQEFNHFTQNNLGLILILMILLIILGVELEEV